MTTTRRHDVLASLGATPGPRKRVTPPFDPMQALADNLVATAHVLVLGQPGTGKSATVKCMVARLLRSPTGGPRRVGIVDLKGEYAALAAALGLDWVRLYRGGPDRLNPLDAGPLASVLGPVHTADRRLGILAALCQTSLGRRLHPAEHRALAAAVELLASTSTGAQPVLSAVVGLLAHPTVEMIGWAERQADGDQLCEWVDGVEPAEMVDAGRRMAHALARLLEGELWGCFDAATTVHTNGGPGLVVDLSGLQPNSTAMRLAALATMAWMEGAEEGADVAWPYNVVDEAWALLGDEHAWGYVNGWLERAEARGVAGILVGHRLADLRWGPTSDSALRTRAADVVAPMATRVILRQSVDDVGLARHALDLSPEETAAIARLGRGQALWKVGGSVGVVVHEIGPEEWAFCADPHGLVL